MNQTTPKADRLLGHLRAFETALRSGRLREAAGALQALAASAPDDWRTPLAAAALARAQRNGALEIESLQRSVALAPSEARPRVDLAKALARAGRNDEALAAIEAGVERAPGDLHAREVAVAVADAAGEVGAAQRHLEAALALRPQDASIRRALARCLARQGRYAEAEPHWRDLLDANPGDLLALEWHASGLLELGRRDEALALLERLRALAPQSPGVDYHAALARGETPRRVPNELTRELFDDYASRFDRELVGGLKYAVPRRVAELIRARSPALDCSILDLGCGTGLLGVYLGPIRDAFIGVDLSPKMLQQAARHGIYTELREGDLRDALRATAAGRFDYVTANDVFIYVGDFAAVLPEARRVLRANGALIFSCEATMPGEPDLVFRPSKRYAHAQHHVETLCREAGFRIAAVEQLTLRLDKHAPVPGFLLVAEPLP